MPVYTYRREDGTTFDYRQKFSDAPLTTDPETGQNVVRVIQPAGVIFKGSGFYVNDSKSASRNSVTSAPKTDHGDHNHNGHDHNHAEKSDKAEKPAEASKPAETTSAKAPAASTAAAD
ncbi:MAG TPA: hypothetical protein VHD90_07445 [Phototrophicaceae bacterium]|nr:hypothetical protein [Phototrophicaceae bacterium]